MPNDRTPVIFYFSFDLDPEFHGTADAEQNQHRLDDESTVRYAFIGNIDTDQKSRVVNEIENRAPWFEDMLEDLESDFGVHNWHSGPDDRVICLGAFASYEVPPSRVMDLMEKWRSSLLRSVPGHPGFGSIVAIPTQDISDWDIFRQAKKNTSPNSSDYH